MTRGPVLSVVDTDDHMYETLESLTRYLPRSHWEGIWSKKTPESLGGDGVTDLIDLLGADQVLLSWQASV